MVHCEYLPATEIMTMIIKDHARAVGLSHVADFKRKRLRVFGLWATACDTAKVKSCALIARYYVLKLWHSGRVSDTNILNYEFAAGESYFCLLVHYYIMLYIIVSYYL